MDDDDLDTSLETLKQLISKVESSETRRHGLRSLVEEITYMREFLKVTEKKRYEHSEVMSMVKQIKDLAFEAESILEIFVDRANRTLNADHQDNPSLRLEDVIKKIQTLTAEIKQIYNKDVYDINGLAGKNIKHSVSKNEGGSSSSGESNTSNLGVVGFKEEINTLLRKLHDSGGGRPLEIIAIIGAGGGGKTTLVKQVYECQLTKDTFIRAWFTVSQDYHKTMMRNLLIHMLLHILESTSSGKKIEDYEKSSDDDLGQEILKCLKGKKYLIVMDDIWGIEAWNDIQRSFPKEGNGSKVLFTSRMSIPIEHDNISYVTHRLNPLPNTYGWELLQIKVFGNKCCPPELVDIGNHIVEKCEGLPLAIVTVAGILAVEDKTLEVWNEIDKTLSSTIAKNEDGCMKILELSYSHLPLHLRKCFCYIGGFPEDSEILVRELIWLWIAEGFIQQTKEDKSLEDFAKDYVSSLIDRNLIMEARKGSFGEIKACRIHDLLRELCLKKAKEDNFLMQIYKDDSFSPSATFKHQRLFVGCRFFNQRSLMPCIQNLHSFLCLNLEKPRELSSFKTELSSFDENFESLRVLSLLSCMCKGEIGRGHLVRLRYLALCIPESIDYENEFLPLPFSDLETLHLVRYSNFNPIRPIQLPRDILKMVKLRHLYAKGGVFSYHPRCLSGHDSCYLDSSSTLDSLQTLYRICSCKDCRKFLEKTPILRTLGISGVRSAYYYAIPNEDVSADLRFLRFLETLSIYKCLMTVRGDHPQELKFPTSLVRLTLEDTFLTWEQLSSLQTLPGLEVLKLSSNACDGKFWNASEEEEGFPRLKYFRLEGLDIEKWDATEDLFPMLEVLVVKYCKELEQIPIEFANLHELQKIEVMGSRRSVEESAREIQEERINESGEDGRINLLAENNVY